MSCRFCIKPSPISSNGNHNNFPTIFILYKNTIWGRSSLKLTITFIIWRYRNYHDYQSESPTRNTAKIIDNLWKLKSLLEMIEDNIFRRDRAKLYQIWIYDFHFYKPMTRNHQSLL